MARPAFQDFDDLTRLWAPVARRSKPNPEAEAQIFNQMAVALAARLPDRPGPLAELQALAEAIRGRGFLGPDPAPITGHGAHDRVQLTAHSFRRLAEACARDL